MVLCYSNPNKLTQYFSYIKENNDLESLLTWPREYTQWRQSLFSNSALSDAERYDLNKSTILKVLKGSKNSQKQP